MDTKTEFDKGTGASAAPLPPWSGKITSLKKQTFIFFVVTTLLTLLITIGIVCNSAGNGASTSLPVYLICLVSLLFITLIVAMLFFQRNVLVPLEKICATTQLMTEGHLETPIQIRAGDEIGKVADLINDQAINMQEILLFIWNYTRHNFELLDDISVRMEQDDSDSPEALTKLKEDVAHIREGSEDLQSIVTSFSYFEIKLEDEKMLSDT